MHGTRSSTSRLYRLVLLAAVLMVAAGCSTLSKDGKSQGEAPPPKSDGIPPVYHDFDDVLIPGEMKVQRDESFIYQTAGFTVGILTLKGRVDIDSLIEFFEKNMPKENWQMVSQFKSPRTMMLFQKQSRWCVVEISERTYFTYAKVWVAPTTNKPSGGLVR